MNFRVTRYAERTSLLGTVRSKQTLEALSSEELVGYVEAEDATEAYMMARDEYGEQCGVVQIDCDPEDDIWPPGADAWQSQAEILSEKTALYDELVAADRDND